MKFLTTGILLFQAFIGLTQSILPGGCVVDIQPEWNQNIRPFPRPTDLTKLTEFQKRRYDELLTAESNWRACYKPTSIRRKSKLDVMPVITV
jgi:hypothetical protein